MPSNPSKVAARLQILVAALMWSTGGLFAKAPVFDDWDPSVRGFLLAFWRAAFAAAILTPMIRRPKWDIRLVPMTLCFSAMCVLYLSAMVLTTAANAIWLQATAPWWVFLITVVAFREPVVRRDLVPLVFGFLGVGMILVFELIIYPQGGHVMIGVLCGVLSGVTYAAVIMFTRKLRDHDAVWLVGLNHIVATALMLPLMLWLGIWPSLGQLAVLAAFGTFQMGIPYVLITRGLRTISSQEAVGICLIEPIVNPLWVFLAWVFLDWGEVPAWWTIVGAALILVGLLLRYVLLGWFGKGDSSVGD